MRTKLHDGPNKYGKKNIFILHISSSWVKIRWHTDNKVPRTTRSGLKALRGEEERKVSTMASYPCEGHMLNAWTKMWNNKILQPDTGITIYYYIFYTSRGHFYGEFISILQLQEEQVRGTTRCVNVLHEKVIC